PVALRLPDEPSTDPLAATSTALTIPFSNIVAAAIGPFPQAESPLRGHRVALALGRLLFVLDLDGAPPLSPKATWEFKSNINSVAVNVSSTGMMNGEVFICPASLDTPPKQLYRFSLAISSVAFHPTEPEVIAFGGEVWIKNWLWLNVANSAMTQRTPMQNGSLKCASFSPDGSVLASSWSDGEVHFWKSDNLKHPLRVFKDMMSNTELADNDRGVVSWSPNGKLVAIPCRDGGIVVLNTQTWREEQKINGSGKMTTSVLWSPDGRFLACSSLDNRLLVYPSAKARSNPVYQGTHKEKICDLAWIESKELLLVDGSKDLIRVPVPLATASVPESESFETSESVVEVPESPPRRRVGSRRRPTVVEPVEVDDDDDGNESDDFVVDDDGGGYRQNLETKEQVEKYYQKSKARAILPRISNSLSVPKVHEYESFQPGSTPLIGNRRFLCYNSLGFIHQVHGSQSSIHVQFHDQSKGGFDFTDLFGFDLGCLNEHGALFATSSLAAAKGGVSLIDFRGNASKSRAGVSVNSWSHKLGLDEAATYLDCLRWYDFSGAQGKIVTMAGVKAFPVCRYQGLSYSLYDATSFTLVSQGKLPLSPGATLEWASFSDLQLPVTFDSQGFLRILCPDLSWQRVFDSRVAREGNQIHYWPVGVEEEQFLCVMCKGGNKMPTPPRCFVSFIDLRHPILVESGRVDTTHEQKLHTLNLKLSVLASGWGFDEDHASENSKEWKTLRLEKTKTLLHLIDDACSANQASRVLSLAEQMPTSPGLLAAAKLAAKAGDGTNRIAGQQLPRTFKSPVNFEQPTEYTAPTALDVLEAQQQQLDHLKEKTSAKTGLSKTPKRDLVQEKKSLLTKAQPKEAPLEEQGTSFEMTFTDDEKDPPEPKVPTSASKRAQKREGLQSPYSALSATKAAKSDEPSPRADKITKRPTMPWSIGKKSLDGPTLPRDTCFPTAVEGSKKRKQMTLTEMMGGKKARRNDALESSVEKPEEPVVPLSTKSPLRSKYRRDEVPTNNLDSSDTDIPSDPLPPNEENVTETVQASESTTEELLANKENQTEEEAFPQRSAAEKGKAPVRPAMHRLSSFAFAKK
ncbi:hypothetical protein DFJ73DRAFT_817776, partial [Zopfochytrium polystomum]